MLRVLRVSMVGALLILGLSIYGGASAAGSSVSIADFSFSPANDTINQGDTVTWTNNGAATHTTTGDAPLSLWNSGNLSHGQSFHVTFTAAGTYAYHCAIHSSMTGKVVVRLKATPATGSAGTQFHVTVASATATAPFVYDIQIKRPGSSTFVGWRSGITAKSATFNSTGQPTGTYSFRSRLRNTSTGAVSGWSPAKTITVSP